MRSTLTPILAGSTLCAFLATGCGASVSDQQVLARASYDTGCSEAQLKVVGHEPLRRTVEGCGSTFVYVKQCGGGVTGRCWWSAEPRLQSPKPTAPAEESLDTDGVDVAVKADGDAALKTSGGEQTGEQGSDQGGDER